ncbi:DegT/DnrJ/EryC1/StrS family aminotransferase [Legionella longbeachae]|uniref:Putative polysaccharide biosynthesis protein n=1 Tax=Legionella longbeachae serogroup 1 (strain NSW150) TaxID=661367 RepID=D3HTD0_LEGLN|nr:DegT/DnrJ/EryC1/StrS family aminotransferase [Legionella longbeachae]VEE02663.1 polysaccharide biosynthesis protein [Legionella oakridgensis]HBD7397925.1 DegT/DnrJ/EryC1/StrS family aminotransferase [Legionella pneumophila]ARB91071.1 DegT/DnrJ/EryC1/StrS family aminotransferase [Legionella longbeachae]ARM32501.1 DegT/DnrJ/EryC1/StrS family aminotransferase [Legionella longbeachae]EEZ94684.1 DegT/DnrJ/EryC1/StrS aminotransferase family [Legionella longbeachae D-4968]
MQFIDLKKQYSIIEHDILNSIRNVLNHGQYIMGPEVAQLEKQLAEFVGVKHVIVNSSGTDALLMALMALEIQPEDEVITTPFSFFATTEVISLCQAKPVFVDIDPLTYNMDPNQLESAITNKTKAIMPVGLYGQCAEHDEINAIAEKYGIPVIEDAAQSFGATYKGRYSCALSTIGCTSFFPSKPLGGYGDSGACFTNDDELAQKLIEIRIHGQNARYCHNRIGINGRMDTIQAAVLIEKMKLFPDEIIMRQRVAKAYDQMLSPLVKIPFIHSYNTSVYAQYTIEVSNRDAFQNAMQELGVPTAVHYPVPLHQQTAMGYLGYKIGDFPHAEQASRRVISLPMHPYLQEAEQSKVVAAVKKALTLHEEEVMA